MTFVQKNIPLFLVLLFISLAVNLYAGGLFIGDYFGCQSRNERHAEWARKDRFLKDKLSAEDKNILRQDMEKNREIFSQKRKELDEARQKVHSAMTAVPFDKKAFDLAMQEELDRKKDLMLLMIEKKAALIEKMSPEGRGIFMKMRQPFPDKERGRSGRSGKETEGWADDQKERGGERSLPK